MMKSRLARHQKKTLTRQAILFLVLALGAIILVIRLGLPLLVKLAIFLGDLKSSSQTIEQADSVAPVPPRLNPLPVATYSATLAARGFSEPGSMVMIFVNELQQGEVVAGSDGVFVFDRLNLSSGANQIWVKAKDQAGNESQTSATTQVTVDAQELVLKLDAPEDQAVVSEDMVEVKGRVSKPEVEVRVNDRFVGVSNDGSFTTKLAVGVGDNVIKVKAFDRAGNQAEVTVTVTR